MHIRRIKGVNNKEEGYILLQSVAILMIIICICTLLNKIILNNYLKSSVIYTSDDVRTLSRLEEETLIQAEIYFKDNIVPYKKEIRVSGEKVRRIIVKLSGTTGELIKDDGNGNHSHIKLECEILNETGGKIVKLKPGVYRTDYIVNCNCVVK
ncbi:MAG: hypothetical protein ACRDA5_02820 [Clostridium sp.]